MHPAKQVAAQLIISQNSHDSTAYTFYRRPHHSRHSKHRALYRLPSTDLQPPQALFMTSQALMHAIPQPDIGSLAATAS